NVPDAVDHMWKDDRALEDPTLVDKIREAMSLLLLQELTPPLIAFFREELENPRPQRGEQIGAHAVLQQEVALLVEFLTPLVAECLHTAAPCRARPLARLRLRPSRRLRLAGWHCSMFRRLTAENLTQDHEFPAVKTAIV